MKCPLHKHFQTVIHAAADKIPPITFPPPPAPHSPALIATILYKSQQKGRKKKKKKEEKKRGGELVRKPAGYLFRLVPHAEDGGALLK